VRAPGGSGSLDQQRWLDLWSRLGAHGGGASIFARLAAAYAETGRAYHTAEHIRDCLAELDLTRSLAQHPDEVEAALWFHDAVYLPGASDNEEQSAELARTALSRGASPVEVTSRIAALVLATRHMTLPTTSDEQLICDIDLSVLGRQPAEFDDFERRIRQEYAWVPEPVYRRERTAMLSGFLRRHSIYQTDQFRLRYELSARANVNRMIAELGGRSP
jgi:predicted metal-dependent HD superfamily phosphohydrolase